MKHLGDICKIKGSEVEKVDVITFGAPCQDISIAGARAGIKHSAHGDDETTRSGLFFEALRIIREMREDDEKHGRAIQFIRPRYAIYENVGGLTSSNNGRDFQKVLTEFVKIVEPDAPEIPMPEKGGWPHADAIYGVGANGQPFSIAWRLHDAAKWGVPQRRKRYCVLADFNGFSAAEILFDPQFERMPARGMSITSDRNLGANRRPEVQTQPEGLSGDSAEGGAQRKGTAAAFGSGPAYSIQGNTVDRAAKQNGLGVSEDVAHTLNTVDRHAVCYPDKVSTLPARMDGSPCIDRGPPIVACLNPWDPQSARVYDANGIWHSLNANENGGQSRDAVFVYENHAQDSRYKELEDVCQTVSATYGMGGNNTPLVLTAIPIEWNGVRPSHQRDGYGNDGDPSFTLNAVEKHAVCIGNGQLNQISMSDKANTLDTMHDQQAVLIAYAPDTAKALKAKANLQFREDGETYIVAGFSYGQSAKAGGIGYEEGKSPTLRGGQGGNQIPCIAAVDCRNGTINPDTNGTLQAKEQGFNLNSKNVVLIWPEVRRLTPLECTRLQGFPDGWLDIGDWTDENGKLHKESDAPKYKAAGNSIALPFWEWLARRICAQYERPITMASLFDGVGGFPLAFSRCGAKPVWASEIEQYPIAVTKKHFPE